MEYDADGIAGEGHKGRPMLRTNVFYSSKLRNVKINSFFG